jgi:hypothetical protein
MADEKILTTMRKRYQLLKALYEKTNHDPSVWIDDSELQKDVGLTPQEYTPMILELHSRGLVKCTHESATIDFPGIREVERLETNPDQRGSYFPSINVMFVGQISHSQIQQGSHHSTQSMQLTQNDFNSLLPFLIRLEQNLGALQLSGETERQARADIATVQTQATAPRPNHTIVKESLKSLRTILEGAIGNAVGTGVAALATPLLQQLIEYGGKFFGS